MLHTFWNNCLVRIFSISAFNKSVMFGRWMLTVKQLMLSMMRTVPSFLSRIVRILLWQRHAKTISRHHSRTKNTPFHPLGNAFANKTTPFNLTSVLCVSASDNFTQTMKIVCDHKTTKEYLKTRLRPMKYVYPSTYDRL